MKAPKALIVIGYLLFAAFYLRAAVPLADFFKDATFSEIRISPDGSKVAALAKWKEHTALSVIDLKTKQPKILTAPDGFDVAGIIWVGSNRLLFTGVDPAGVYSTQGHNGGVFAIDADGGNSRTLCESVGQQISRGARVARIGQFLNYCGRSTDEVLITYNERVESDPDVYRLNVRTGGKRVVAQNPGGVESWVADHTGAVRAAYGQRGLDRFVLYRDTADGAWREIRRWKISNENASDALMPLAFNQDNTQLYAVRSHGENRTQGLVLFDPKANKVIKSLASDETYDIENVILSRVDFSLKGYYYEGERGQKSVWTDQKNAMLQAMVDQALPTTCNVFSSRSADDALAIIVAYSDRDPGTFYLLDTKINKLTKIISAMDWIDPKQMSEIRPVQYQARDGMTIHGYLTLPKGKEARNLPLIVNPHGGPWARDSWSFNPEVQFLASRGYAVLQMNFRGSTGYGGKLLEAGYGQWGLAMQDDITDGVKWAIAQGYADPDRVAIYGASYGGYATMAGLAFTPELYRCGVNYVGVTDIKLLMKTIPKSWTPARAELELKTGEVKHGTAKAEPVSPLENAKNIKVPVFFAYGELDERVNLKHATRFISQLRANGVPVEFMVKNDEGHGYQQTKNKVEFYGKLEQFLAKYMAPRNSAPVAAQ